MPAPQGTSVQILRIVDEHGRTSLSLAMITWREFADLTVILCDGQVEKRRNHVRPQQMGHWGPHCLVHFGCRVLGDEAERQFGASSWDTRPIVLPPLLFALPEGQGASETTQVGAAAYASLRKLYVKVSHSVTAGPYLPRSPVTNLQASLQTAIPSQNVARQTRTRISGARV